MGGGCHRATTSPTHVPRVPEGSRPRAMTSPPLYKHGESACKQSHFRIASERPNKPTAGLKGEAVLVVAVVKTEEKNKMTQVVRGKGRSPLRMTHPL